MISAPEILMSEPKPPVLRAHHTYRSWTSMWWDAQGHRRCKRFGKEGEVTKQQANARYKHWKQTKWDRHEYVKNPDSELAQMRASELASQYLEHARKTFVKNGEETSHVWQVAYAMRSLTDHYGTWSAAAVEAPHLAQLRDAMIWTTDAKGQPKQRAMKTVNGRLYCIKAAYKWARERGHVPAETLADLLTVQPLQKGRSEAKDPVKVRPIAQAIVWDTMKECTPILAAMIELQWWTGMRPEEICVMRPCDIDASGEVWCYTPSTHKMEHADQVRKVWLGKRSQKVVKKFLKRDTTAYMFRPVESVAAWKAAKLAARKTPIGYGNSAGTNQTETPKRQPGEVYDSETYRKAIHRACKRLEIDQWNPNQIRHAWATRVRKEFGIEEASAGLGHEHLDTTLIYAEQNETLARQVAKKVG